MTTGISDVSRQSDYYDHIRDVEFEINRPHGESRLYQFLMDYKLKRVLRLASRPLTNLTVLVVCSGSGMDAEFVARTGARVVALDISQGCLDRARIRSQRYGVSYELVRAAAEHLPFPDGTFDYAFVHDGLHHLADPSRAVTEMARVARMGILVTEPAQAAVTGVPTRMRLMRAYEESGNFINRLRSRDLENTCRSLGFDRIAHSRYLVRYGHPPPEWWRALDRRGLFAIAQASFLVFGAGLLGRWGNKLAFVAERSAPQ